MMDGYNYRVTLRAVQTLEAYRKRRELLRYIAIEKQELLENLRDHINHGATLYEAVSSRLYLPALEMVERVIAMNRRNYAVSRKLGRDWEAMLHDKYPIRDDTKLEGALYLLPGSYRMRIARLRPLDFTVKQWGDEISTIADEDIYDVEFEECADTTGLHFLVGFLEETNTLYFKTI